MAMWVALSVGLAMSLFGLGDAVMCNQGTVTEFESFNCSSTRLDTPLNVTIAIPCCKREVRGPSVRLGCAEDNALCEKDKCYKKNEERDGSGLDFKRSFDCYCAGDNCNPAAALLPSALSLLAATLAAARL